MILTAGCRQEPSEQKGLFAQVVTNRGDLFIQLDYESHPVATAQFICMAEGTSPFVPDSIKGIKVYNGVALHSGNENFWFYAGDSIHTGYRIDNTCIPDSTKITPGHSVESGILVLTGMSRKMPTAAFALAKENIAGNKEYCPVGKTVKGEKLLQQLNAGDTIRSVEIIRSGKKARKFDAPEVLKEHLDRYAGKLRFHLNLLRKDLIKITALSYGKRLYFENLKKQSIRLPGGAKIVYLHKSGNKKPGIKDSINIYYAGYFSDGRLFETNRRDIILSYELNNPENYFTPYGFEPVRVEYNRKMPLIQGLKDAVLTLSAQDKAIVYIPYYLAFGEDGSPPVIPPRADLIYEVETTGGQ